MRFACFHVPSTTMSVVRGVAAEANDPSTAGAGAGAAAGDGTTEAIGRALLAGKRMSVCGLRSLIEDPTCALGEFLADHDATGPLQARPGPPASAAADILVLASAAGL